MAAACSIATGAAIACPDRRVVSLQADGSAMYTVQALWTQAREKLDVTTVLLSNRKYQILIGELANVGTAAAVANAVYHATGIRIRDLPIRPDKLVMA